MVKLMTESSKEIVTIPEYSLDPDHDADHLVIDTAHESLKTLKKIGTRDQVKLQAEHTKNLMCQHLATFHRPSNCPPEATTEDLIAQTQGEKIAPLSGLHGALHEEMNRQHILAFLRTHGVAVQMTMTATVMPSLEQDSEGNHIISLPQFEELPLLSPERIIEAVTMGLLDISAITSVEKLDT